VVVRRLAYGDAPSRAEHEMELAERRVLLTDVDKDRARRHHVDRPVGDWPETLGGGPNELSPLS
jgi:hypothetical protein